MSIFRGVLLMLQKFRKQRHHVELGSEHPTSQKHMPQVDTSPNYPRAIDDQIPSECLNHKPCELKKLVNYKMGPS